MECILEGNFQKMMNSHLKKVLVGTILPLGSGTATSVKP